MTPLRLQPVEPVAQADARRDDQPQEAFDFRGPWFTSKTAAAYLCCPSVKAFYEWRRRHGIVPRNNGTVAKADLDRALRLKRRPHRMHPRSLANLRLRRG